MYWCCLAAEVYTRLSKVVWSIYNSSFFLSEVSDRSQNISSLPSVLDIQISDFYPKLLFDDVCYYTKRLSPFWPFLPWKNVENAVPHPSSKIKWLGIVCKNCFFCQTSGTNIWDKLMTQMTKVDTCVRPACACYDIIVACCHRHHSSAAVAW